LWSNCNFLTSTREQKGNNNKRARDERKKCGRVPKHTLSYLSLCDLKNPRERGFTSTDRTGTVLFYFKIVKPLSLSREKKVERAEFVFLNFYLRRQTKKPKQPKFFFDFSSLSRSSNFFTLFTRERKQKETNLR